MTFSVPSFLHAATSLFIPPKAATEVGVAALVPLEPEPLLLFEPLLQPVATIRPLTARAATASIFLLGTSSPSEVRGHWPAGHATVARTEESSRAKLTGRW